MEYKFTDHCIEIMTKIFNVFTRQTREQALKSDRVDEVRRKLSASILKIITVKKIPTDCNCSAISVKSMNSLEAPTLSCWNAFYTLIGSPIIIQ